MKISTSSQHH